MYVFKESENISAANLKFIPPGAVQFRQSPSRNVHLSWMKSSYKGRAKLLLCPFLAGVCIWRL